MKRSPTARSLFIERMKREGKYEEWRRRYKDAKKDVAPEDWKTASDKVMEEMGFLGKLVEREIHERFLKFGMAGIPEQIEAAQAQLDQNDLIKVLGEYDITESELPIDIAFVFHNLHKAVGDMTSWKVTPEDAPTPGAWNMLIWATANQTKFFDKVLGDKLKQGAKSEDQGMRDTGESVEQIEQMLGQLS
jgi:hypothetical protein